MHQTRTFGSLLNSLGIRLFLFTIVSLGSLSCEMDPPPQSPETAATQNANTPNTAPVVPTPEPKASPVPFPVIDAVLSDDATAAEAAQATGIPEDKLNKIKDAARDAVLKLDEGDDDARSRKLAASAADKRVRELIGAEAANRLFKFIHDRWSGDPSLLVAEPNAVPGDSRIVVNSPAYRMDIFVDGHLKKSYRAGIGYPEFPLPLGLRKAEKIIFNPEWLPPDSPWVRGKYRPGKKVAAGSKDNPLGVLKIPIGLPSLIHGGKRPERLGNFASHGCVGLTNELATDFALELASLSGSSLTPEQVKAYGGNKTKTVEFPLANSVPVELRYETIVVEDGVVRIYRDVYEHGTNTEEQLRKVLSTFGVEFDSLPPETQAALLKGLDDMSRDAAGRPIEEDEPPSGKQPNPRARETKNVKGVKEVAIEVPQLKGKGYPAPIYFEAAPVAAKTPKRASAR